MKLFSKQNCPNCEVIKNFIKDNNIEVEIDNSCNREVASIYNIMQFPYLIFEDDKGEYQATAGVENIQAILSTLIKPKDPEFFWGK